MHRLGFIVKRGYDHYRQCLKHVEDHDKGILHKNSIEELINRFMMQNNQQRKNPVNEFVVLSDFDGTIAEDLSIMIYKKFASVGMYYADLWTQGLISTPEELAATFKTIDASPSQLADLIRQAHFDPDFPEFVRLCMERGFEVAIVSDGLAWAIQTSLAQHGVHDVEIYANQIHFVDGAYQISFPWRDEKCPQAGVCKSKVVANFHAAGKRVIYIGDGRSDHDAVHAADIVYAKDQLLEYCRSEQVSAIPFQNFSDLVLSLKSGVFTSMMP
jgi:2-hydroxy-3-keto-5-methylthiopentenyl-1-phosphate phosphatase